MIRHIVIFEMEDEKATLETLTGIKTELEALVNKIPELIKMEVGINVNSAEKQHLVLTAVVKDMHDLEVYAKHPEHVKVGGLIRPILKMRTCVDYEI